MAILGVLAPDLQNKKLSFQVDKYASYSPNVTCITANFATEGTAQM